MADVAMPRLSDSMEEGTILKWLKSDGDEVKRGEELVEIETDKANMTYEADSDGTLTIVAKEGDTLPVGETIARLGDGSEPAARTRRPRRGARGGAAAEEPEAEDEAEEEPEEDDLRQRQARGGARAGARAGRGALRQRRRRPHQGLARRQADGARDGRRARRARRAPGPAAGS